LNYQLLQVKIMFGLQEFIIPKQIMKTKHLYQLVTN
jgi:hypothetical protein